MTGRFLLSLSPLQFQELRRQLTELQMSELHRQKTGSQGSEKVTATVFGNGFREKPAFQKRTHCLLHSWSNNRTGRSSTSQRVKNDQLKRTQENVEL